MGSPAPAIDEAEKAIVEAGTDEPPATRAQIEAASGTTLQNIGSWQQFLELIGWRTPTVIDDRKMDYFFGKVSSNAHNAARSAQNLTVFRRIGIHDNAEGRAFLRSHLDEVAQASDNVLRRYTDAHGTFEIRESLLMGPGGGTKLRSTWQVLNDGARRLTTVIPVGG